MPYKDKERHREEAKAYHHQYYLDNIDRIRIYAKNYREEHKEEIRQRGFRNRALNKETRRQKARIYHLKKKYNTTPEEYDALLERQGGGCAICGKRPKKKRLHIDHNHSNGQIRGLLCFHCNYILVAAVERFRLLVPITMLYLDGRLQHIGEEKYEALMIRAKRIAK